MLNVWDEKVQHMLWWRCKQLSWLILRQFQASPDPASESDGHKWSFLRHWFSWLQLQLYHHASSLCFALVGQKDALLFFCCSEFVCVFVCFLFLDTIYRLSLDIFYIGSWNHVTKLPHDLVNYSSTITTN